MFFIMFTSSCASKNIHQASQNNKEHQIKKKHSIQMTHLVPMILVDRYISGGIVRDGPLFSFPQQNKNTNSSIITVTPRIRKKKKTWLCC